MTSGRVAWVPRLYGVRFTHTTAMYKIPPAEINHGHMRRGSIGHRAQNSAGCAGIAKRAKCRKPHVLPMQS